MLPIPLISDWSSSARLIPVLRRAGRGANAAGAGGGASRAANAAGSKAASSGSGAMCEIGSGTRSTPPGSGSSGLALIAGTNGATIRWPNVRWSVKRRSGPPSVNVKRARTCDESSRSGSPTSSWPLMPRCARRASPSSRANHMYLPRRSARVNVRPVIAAVNPAGPAGSRRTARGFRTWAVATVRPSTCCSRPARTVSTSGSSGIDRVGRAGLRRHGIMQRGADRASRLVSRRPGIGQPSVARLCRRAESRPCSAGALDGFSGRFRSRRGPFEIRMGLILWFFCGAIGGDEEVGGLGRELPGGLLRPALALAEVAGAHLDHRLEHLLVVGAAVPDVVLGHAEAPVGGQLLQRRLPVEPGPEQRRALDDRVEQTVHEPAGLVEPAVDVRRADHRLERVGQDRRLVTAAGPLLAPAEPDERPEVELARGDLGERAHLDHRRPELGH